MDYAIRVVPIFPLCPLHPSPPTPQAILPPLFIPMGHVYKFSGYSISYAVLYSPHAYSVTTRLYFLTPSPLYPFPHMLLPSGNHQNPLLIHDSVCVLLVCLVCFIDSTVDGYVFISILLFMVLIFFFLSIPL